MGTWSGDVVLVHMFMIDISKRVIGENGEEKRCKKVVVMHCSQVRYSAESAFFFLIKVLGPVAS